MYNKWYSMINTLYSTSPSMGLYIIIGKFQPRSLPNCPRLPYDRGKNIQGFENYQEIREKQESLPEFSNKTKTGQSTTI
jgi:hypothetical protein